MIKHLFVRRLAPVVCLLLLGACSSSSGSKSTSGNTPGVGGTASPTGIHPGYPTDIDQISPLVITTLAPDPIPFNGTDGKVHLAYELQIFNASPRPATMTTIETLEGGPTGEVLASLSADDLAARSLLVGPPLAQGETAVEIPGGRVALVLLDGVYDNRADVPPQITHRISATFAVSSDDDRVTALYPTQASQIGGVVTPRVESPLVIGPPVAGDHWLTTGSCCKLDGHRAFMMPIGGRMNGTERYGLEYVRLDVDAKPLIDKEAGLIGQTRGDPTKNESYLAWDQPVLAVADGIVVTVVSDVEDRPPGSFAEGLPLNNLTGNGVIIDLGNGVHAMSNHLRQGSVTVKVGDQVRRGQVIGRLGNSGNTFLPHLHFQMFRGIAPLAGDNVPFEIDRFVFDGELTSDGMTNPTPAGPRTNQYPLTESVTSYPPA